MLICNHHPSEGSYANIVEAQTYTVLNLTDSGLYDVSIGSVLRSILHDFEVSRGVWVVLILFTIRAFLTFEEEPV